MKTTPLIALAFLMIAASGCKTPIDREEVLHYYQTIKIENVDLCQKQISDQNRLLNEYGKLIFYQDNVESPGIYIQELKDKQSQILDNLEQAIERVSAIKEIEDKAGLKNESLNFLKSLLEFESKSRYVTIEALAKAPDEGQIQRLKEQVESLKKGTKAYKQVALAFVSEFELTNEELKAMQE